MMKLIVASFLFYFAVQASQLFEENHVKQLFTQYQRDYNKQYSNEEFGQRYQNFKASLIRSTEKNAKSTKAQYGITKFSDLSVEEFQTKVLMRNPITPKEIKTSDVAKVANPVTAAPPAFDWRDKNAVTAVKNQEQCGSCWAFSVTENIESMWIVAGRANDSLALAPQQIVDCDDGDGGCNGGEPYTAYEYVMGTGGLEGEASYPYMGEDGTCNFQKNDIIASISTYEYATEWYNEQTLQSSLLSVGPLSVCVDAASWQDYMSGVMSWEECAFINVLDHCVQLVGYNATDSNNAYWIVRNSWATDWGVDGYIWLEMWEDTCGISHMATYSVVSKKDE